MGVIRSLAAFLLFGVIVFFGPHHGSAEIFNRVVAIVNDDVITLYELNKRTKQMTGSTADDLRAQNEKGYLETRRKILELMIEEKCLQEKIRELEIKVETKEIDAVIENMKRNNQWTQEDLVAKLKTEGLTLEEYRDEIKADLERYTLINAQISAKIIIREEEMIRYYEEHKADFSTEDAVRLGGIFLIRKNPNDAEEIRELQQKGEDILARLRNGEDFAELARQLSEGPGADEGGDLGVIEMVQLDPDLKKAIEGLEVGEYTDLITKENGIQIIKLIERQRGGVKPFEEVRDVIHATLYQEEQNKRYTSWIKELRNEAYTRVIF